MTPERKAELRERYLVACHAMQSGVAFIMNKESAETDAKHLRVGINSALANANGLADLLIKKGLISEEEYYESMAEAMEKEVATYEARAKASLGSEGTVRFR